MFWLLKNHKCPIGADIRDDGLKLAQLGDNAEGISLIAGGSENRPEGVKPGSANWQRWAIEAIEKLTVNGKFQGRNVVATMPTGEVFVDNIKVPKVEGALPGARKCIWGRNGKLQNAVFAKIKKELPFDPDDAMINYILTEDDNAVVIAAQRKKIDMHLAIYEKVGLKINSLSVWPTAMTNSYSSLFARYKVNAKAIVMLLDIESNYTNFVICRHKNLLFARSIPIGADQFESNEKVEKLVQRLTDLTSYFSLMYKEAQIKSLIFFSCCPDDSDVYIKIAKQLEMPAQMADCLEAVEITDACLLGIEGNKSKFSWATAFGLSLL
jgi:Tfp pilus assembly PilM family ATPase